MNTEQVTATLRILIGYGVTYAIAKGWVLPADADVIVSSLVALAVPVAHTAYIFYTNTQKKVQDKALTTVAALPPTTPEVAKAAEAAATVVAKP